MPARSFSITASAAKLTLDATGKSEVVFTVTNAAASTVRGQAKLQVIAPTLADWITVETPERNFAPAETHNFTAALKFPPATPAGNYTFRLDVCNTANPDDDYTEGPLVAATVAATAAPAAKKPFPYWIIFLIAGLLIAGGVTTAVLLMKKKKPDIVKTPEPEPEPEPPVATMTTVPNFIKNHTNIEDVTNLFGSSANLTVEVLPQPHFIADATIKPNSITKQDPAPGTSVPAGTTVKVSLQPKFSAVPNVINFDLANAITSLRNANMNLKVPVAETWTDNTNQFGKISAQVPAQGTLLPDGSEVALTAWQKRGILVYPPIIFQHLEVIKPLPIKQETILLHKNFIQPQ